MALNFFVLSNEEKNVKWKQQIKWPYMLPISIRLKMGLLYLQQVLLIGRLQNNGSISLRKAGS